MFIFMGLVIVYLILVAFSPQIAPQDPYQQDLEHTLEAPSSSHLLGTDRYGRDLLSRVIVGSQTTVFSALILVIIITATGTLIGLFCGYFGGVIDSILMRIADIFLAFPGMVFAIAVAGVLSSGIIGAVIALAAISWPKYARLARSKVLTLKNSLFTEALRMNGCSGARILFLHILPNMIGTIIVTAVLDIGTIMMELAGLSFLGLGANPPIAEWGSMMSNGRSMLQTVPWVVLVPGAAIFLTVVLFNLLGDSLRDAFDPRNS